MSNYIPSDSESYTTAFSALSNPHRLQIYTMLSGCCEPGTRCLINTDQGCCVGEIGRHLDIAASTLSHHLKEMCRAQLIEMNRDGKQIYCTVNPGMMEKMREFFNHNSAPAANKQG